MHGIRASRAARRWHQLGTPRAQLCISLSRAAASSDVHVGYVERIPPDLGPDGRKNEFSPPGRWSPAYRGARTTRRVDLRLFPHRGFFPMRVPTCRSGESCARCPALSRAARAKSRWPRPLSPTAAANRCSRRPERDDWSSIRAAYEAGRHRAFAVDGGHRARNPGQQWTTRFDGRGFTTTPDAGGWSWGLELVSYGFAGRTSATWPSRRRVSAEGRRVAYDWDERARGVVRQRRARPGAWLHRRASGRPRERRSEPAGCSTLAVRGELRAEVAAPTAATCASLDDDGARGAHLRAGSPCSMPTGEPSRRASSALADGLRLAVDERGARYPLTIDPDRPAGLPQGLEHRGRATSSAVRWRSRATRWWSGRPGRTAAPPASTATRATTAPPTPARPTSSCATARPGASRPTSRPPTPRRTTTSAIRWRCRATRWWSGRIGEDSNATGVNGDQSNNSASGSGAAYVFVRSGTTWSQQAYLKASNTGAGDQFGYSVAVSGDTVVVGAHLRGQQRHGRERQPEQQQRVTAPARPTSSCAAGRPGPSRPTSRPRTPGRDDSFGSSVAVSGDTVVVGACYEDSNATGVNGNQSNNSATDSGAAYVFVRSGTTWSQQAYLKASNTGGERPLRLLGGGLGRHGGGRGASARTATPPA